MGGTQGGTQGGSQGGERQSYLDTLQGVTIKQIIGAGTEGGDDKFVINGQHTQQVTLVARIKKAEVQVTMISLLLDDCTGLISGSHMLPADEEMATNEFAVQKRARIKDGAWVRVTGTIQVMDGERRLSIYRIRPVDDANEIMYHRLDAVKTFLAQTRAKGNVNGVTSAAPMQKMETDMDIGADTGAADGLNLNPVHRAIFDYVKGKMNVSRNGVTVEEVRRDAAMGSSLAHVKEVLDTFAADGHMYTTIDENHYAFCKM